MDLSTNNAEIKTGGTKGGLLLKISIWILLVSVFLSPIIFIPSSHAPLDVVKAFFVCFTVLAAALFYSIDAAKHRSFSIPRSPFGYAACAIIVITIISSLVSGSLSKSFFGQGFEFTTTSFLLVMVLAAFLVSRIVIRSRETIFKLYSALFISFVLLATYHIARLIGGADFMSFGLLNSVTTTLMGKWYDFAALTAVVSILSLVGIKFLPLKSGLRKILYVSLVSGGFLLYVVNSAFLWSVIAIVVLGFMVYEYSSKIPTGTGIKKIASRFSILTLIVFVIAVALAWRGDVLARKAVDGLKAQYGELVLPWQMTLGVTSNILQDAPFFGSGPNTFGTQYLKYKPVVINQTPFWNTEFTTGFGYVPTIAVTSGFLGIIAWIIFLVFFVREGTRALRRNADPLKKFFLTSSFFSALFLWMFSIVYVPSHVSIFLTAIFTGIFVGLLVSEGIIMERVIAVREGSRASIVPAVFYVSVVILAVWLGGYVKKSIAIMNFQKGIKELSTGKSADSAHAYFQKALTWDSSDVYYQALSETNVIKINALAQEMQLEVQAGKATDQKKSDQLVALITDSLKYTKTAEEIDGQNYYNFLAEARISEIGTSLKIPNAYENAKNAYMKAIEVNPLNPSLYLNLARLEASQNKLTDAQQYIGRALQIKPNYIDAVFLLSQVQVANNQIKEAMTSTAVAIQLNPNEPLLHFQLGLLAYSSKDYQTGLTALERAVALNKDYANARYFLGLSYARVGKNGEAIAQFEEIMKTNADNEEVQFILTNLKAGKSPFTDAQPPIDSKPEQRKTLPVTEKADSTTATPTKK